MFWHVSPWIYPVWDSLHFLDLIDYFLSHIREVFNYNLLKYFLSPFLFLFFFWDHYNSNVAAFNVVPEVSESVLNSFHTFLFILLCGSYFHYFISQGTYLFLLPQLFHYWLLVENFKFHLLWYSSLFVCSLVLLGPC